MHSVLFTYVLIFVCFNDIYLMNLQTENLNKQLSNILPLLVSIFPFHKPHLKSAWSMWYQVLSEELEVSNFPLEKRLFGML